MSAHSGPVLVTDPDDPSLDDFRDLKRADRRPDRPGGRGLVLAEGTVVVRRLLASAYPVRALIGVQRRYDELAADLADVDVPFFVVTPELMAEVVGFHLNRGVIAAADRIAFPPAAELLARSRTVAVLEGVGDHENLGALFRSAAALGVGAVLLAADCADPLYRRSVRVSMGTVLGVPFAPLPGWVDGGVELLHDHGFRIVAMTPRADAVPMRRADLGGRIAVLVGSEGPGLSAAALAAADVPVRIPMAPGVDSLNVATAAAIAFAALDTGLDDTGVDGPGSPVGPDGAGASPGGGGRPGTLTP
ncbi:RNA methyltransferase [Nakamurella flavida]|uniref:RNA methyltransferase n=1 Tax=Nakamurella flavida TaxID=363630 RepID=A0A939C4W4_9ACTN|nr:RNA methyltransferase [Nakamurella flavida]MBM9475622.1 RNA methyltransferase [Nakamurella flavida]MDP9778102.1 tRNA G18 (ribose-2'-O)-methylase SpoU [Nakamurella flavida]